ncbi:MAG TPA: hypothetical protein VGK29_09415 [Paludibaculum sp.]|jgi:hypothetical protein
MSTPPAPPHAELLDRPFSFYPPISGIENNEWRLVEATWSDILVRNTQVDLQLPIPRRYFGGISETDKPVVIVGLTQELEFKTGAIWPMKRTLLKMPPPAPMTRPPGPEPPFDPSEPTGLSAIMGLGGSGTDSKMTRMIAVTFLSLMALSLVIWAVIKFSPATKPTYVAKDQDYLGLTREDDSFSIIRRLGQPAEDRWKPDSGELQYRSMVYPARGYAVILMGTKQEDARYIGTMTLGPDGKGWSPIHAIDFDRGANTMAILHTLPRF